MLLTLGICLATASFSSVYCLTCLHCTDIEIPRHCKHVIECPSGEVCHIHLTTNTYGEVLYDLGCTETSTCFNGSHGNHSCDECCSTDVCNAAGCGQPGFPSGRGPICYSCSAQATEGSCHTIDFCEINEMCMINEEREFGETVYRSRCAVNAHCETHKAESATIVGRSLSQNIRSVTETVCHQCCHRDMCNAHCHTSTKVDYCASNPCVHGRCVNGMTGYTCVCDPVYKGHNCSEVDYCAAKPCVHGRCVNGMTVYTCVCDSFYTGQNCSAVGGSTTQPSASVACKTCAINQYCPPNMPACFDCHISCINCTSYGENHCLRCKLGYRNVTGSCMPCPPNTFGPDCASTCHCLNPQDPTECSPANGHCTSSQCAQGWQGVPTCQTQVDYCASNPCVHGRCVNGMTGYTCICDPMYMGQNCSEVDYCASNPCVHGRCVNGMTSNTCVCDPMYKGHNCSEVDYCASNSCVHGRCVNAMTGYTCICDPIYMGQNCSEVDYCASNPCVNGRCVNGMTSYTCVCDPMYKGHNCSEVDYCASNPCVHGRCVNGMTVYTCVCDPMYIGQNCSEVYYCASNPCVHGRCVNGMTGYTCVCDPLYMGQNCSEVDYCASNPCVHGRCVNGLTGYTCVCDPMYMGRNCSEVDFCASNPCVHGRCVNGMTSYTCVCDPLFKGQNCSVKSLCSIQNSDTDEISGSCNFNRGKCGYRFPPNLWYIHSENFGGLIYGKIPGDDHGQDQTFANFQSNDPKVNDTERVVSSILSPIISSEDGAVCLKFWFLMPNHNSRLEVFVVTPGDNASSLVFENKYKPASQWQEVKLEVSSAKPFQIKFESVKENNYGYVGLDHIQVLVEKS